MHPPWLDSTRRGLGDVRIACRNFGPMSPVQTTKVGLHDGAEAGDCDLEAADTVSHVAVGPREVFARGSGRAEDAAEPKAAKEPKPMNFCNSSW